MTDARIIDWLERVSTLHQQVEILYVVDGYEVQLTYDGEPIFGQKWRGETLREAFEKTLKQ